MKKGVLKVSQNLQENTCARVSFLIKLHNFSYRTLAASEGPSQFFCYKVLRILLIPVCSLKQSM